MCQQHPGLPDGGCAACRKDRAFPGGAPCWRSECQRGCYYPDACSERGPMCDCHNPPQRLAAHDDVADERAALFNRITSRLLDARGWSVNNPTRAQRLACERDARAVLGALN